MLKIQIAVVSHFYDLQHSLFSGAKHLPGDNIGMMFLLCHDYLIAFSDEPFAERKSDQID